MPTKDVKTITELKRNIDNKSVLCLYYWNSCRHCIEFKPIWEKVLQKSKNNNINSIMVELSVLKKLNDIDFGKYGVQAFPTICYYNVGYNNKVLFNYERNEANLQKFINKFINDK